jgi:hypothetical protein
LQIGIFTLQLRTANLPKRKIEICNFSFCKFVISHCLCKLVLRDRNLFRGDIITFRTLDSTLSQLISSEVKSSDLYRSSLKRYIFDYSPCGPSRQPLLCRNQQPYRTEYHSLSSSIGSLIPSSKPLSPGVLHTTSGLGANFISSPTSRIPVHIC